MVDLQRLTRTLLHAIAAAVPLATTNLTWLPFVDSSITFDEYDVIKVAILYGLVLAALATWALHALRDGGELRRSRAGWIVLAIVAWGVLTTVLSTHPPTSILGQYRRYDGLATLVAYAAIYFLALQSIVTPQHRRSLARTISLSGAAVALYGISQYVGFDPFLRTELPFSANQSFSTLGNPNFLGGYLLFPMTLSAVLALSESRIGWRVIYWVVLLVTGFSLLTTFTRGAWIAGAVALAIVAMAFLRSSLRPTWVEAGFGGAGLVGATVLALRSASSSDSTTNVVERFVSAFRFGEGSALQRTQVWKGAVDSIRDAPLLGHGPDTFRLVFPRYRPRDIVTDWGWQSTADNSHNYLLQTASGMGLPGVVLLYGFFAYALVASAHGAFSRERPPQALLLLGFWAAALGYLVHLVFAISVVGSTCLLWMGLAVLLGPTARVRTFSPPSWGKAAGILVVVVAAGGIALSAMIPIADHYFLEANQSPSLETRLSSSEKAIRLNPLEAAYRPQPGDVHLAVANSWLMQANVDIGAGRSEETSLSNALAASESAVEAYEEAIRSVPAESENYANLAIASNQAGQIEPSYYLRAVDAVSRGLEADPQSPVLRVNGALAYFKLGQTEKAITMADEAAKIDPRYARPHILLGDIYVSQGRVDLARAEYEIALDLEPTDLTALRGLQRLDED